MARYMDKLRLALTWSGEMKKGPTFIVIGAMKCMTSTLHDQLALQPGIFMTTPKEPCYFSDDDVYARGESWYEQLFAAAEPRHLRGESSTHYTKLPSHPETIDRLYAALPDVKLIYVMRHPVERLVSQYVHEWTERRTNSPIDQALHEGLGLVEYSRYAYQLRPFLDRYGFDGVLPIFFECLRARPQRELERVAKFIGYDPAPRWRLERYFEASAERLRRSPLRDLLVEARPFAWARRTLVPKTIRKHVRGFWQMKDRPQLSPQSFASVRDEFDQDLEQLGEWFAEDLNCENFREVVTSRELCWQAGANALAASGVSPSR